MKRILPPLLIAPLLLLSACNSLNSRTTQEEQVATETNQQRMVNAVPLPQLQTSLERKNLARRLQHLNRENQTSYIYLVNYGRIMGYYTVAGKVSSLNSYLTGRTTFARPCTGCDIQPVESPDLDGAYGENDGGIFFFTTEGTYVEWRGDYLWTDQPLKLAQPPELIMNVR